MPSALAKKFIARRKARKDFRVLQGTPAPLQIEILYRNEMLGLVNRLIKATKIKPLMEGFTPDAGKEQRAAEVIRNIRELLSPLSKQSNRIAKRVAKNANATHKKRFVRQMKEDLGIDVTQLLKEEKLTRVMNSKIKENVSIMENVSQNYLNQISSIVRRSMTTGTTESMIEQIQKVQKKTKSRAKLIARDQAAKFNSALTRTRQEGLGIEEYVWLTSRDERVRDTHRRNDGKVFRWDDPPTETGHPGEDINCRCIARPVLNIRGTETSKTAIQKRVGKVRGRAA